MPKQDEDVKTFEEVSKVDEDDTVEEEDKEEDDESSDDDSDSDEDSKDDDKDDSEDDEKETHADSSPDKKPDSDKDDSSDEDDDSDDEDDKTDTGGKPLKDGIVETPRERALRIENQRLRDAGRRKKGDDLFDKEEVPVKKQEISPDKKERLKKYKAEELDNLREVLDVMADDLGFVKKDDYQKSSYANQAKDILDDFLEDHPEYDPVNDKDDVLWNRFQAEYKLYKLPESPRDLKKLFKKIHNDVVGIKPQSDLRKIEAKKEKLDVASHPASKSKTKTKPEQVVDRSRTNVDRETARKGLKGFTEEEIDELLS